MCNAVGAAGSPPEAARGNHRTGYALIRNTSSFSCRTPSAGSFGSPALRSRFGFRQNSGRLSPGLSWPACERTVAAFRSIAPRGIAAAGARA